MTSDSPMTWTHDAIAQAYDLHPAMLSGSCLLPEERDRILAAPLQVRRAARTIAACTVPPALIPEDPEIGSILPLPDALCVLASGEDWLRMSADAADEIATGHLIDLQRHYEVSHLTPADVIAATLLEPAEIAALPDRCAALRANGDGDSALAEGLARALARACPAS